MRSIPHPEIKSIVPATFSFLFFSPLCIIDYLLINRFTSYLILNENISRQISQFDRDRGIDI